ncbi:MAG: pyridoxamine 5'-phosphate oxidase family protein [Cyanobacteria bacterium P01_D01_bin.36]
MAKQYSQITPKLQSFIEQQKVFFVGTAAAEGRVNVSPKGMDSFRVLGPNRAVWLSVTGSGNETAAHIAALNRMTVMFCALESAPMILRLYGSAQPVYPRDATWDELAKHFSLLPGTRQLFDFSVDLVQTSCGMAVPLYDYQGDRTALNQWADKKGPEAIEDYQREKNQVSIDGFPTHLFAD